MHGAACETQISTGTIQALVARIADVPAKTPGKAGMWATWQMEQVASEPGASQCHNETPEAISNTAANAARSVARSSHRSCCFPFLIPSNGAQWPPNDVGRW